MLQASGDLDPGEFVGLLYRDRMRTLEDKQRVSSVPQTNTHCQRTTVVVQCQSCVSFWFVLFVAHKHTSVYMCSVACCRCWIYTAECSALRDPRTCPPGGWSSPTHRSWWVIPGCPGGTYRPPAPGGGADSPCTHSITAWSHWSQS